MVSYNANVLHINPRACKDMVDGKIAAFAAETVKGTNAILSCLLQQIPQMPPQKDDRLLTRAAVQIPDKDSRHPFVDIRTHVLPDQAGTLYFRFRAAMVQVRVAHQEWPPQRRRLKYGPSAYSWQR